MDNQQTPAKKTLKPKSPIRVEAITPFLIVCAVIVLYFTLFFDMHLKKAIQWGATYVNGAEVDVGKLKTSFLNASFSMDNIEVTNPTKPEQNRIEIGHVGFNLSWDALLRAKFVVNLAAINEIKANSERTRPGYVLPPETAKSRESIKNKIVDEVKEKFSKTSLANVAALLQGFDPMKAIGDLGNLKSAARITELSSGLTKKEAEWNSMLSSLPGDKDIGALQSKIAGIQTAASNPAEAATKISEITGTIKETEGKLDQVKSQGGKISTDIAGYTKSVSEIDGLVKADREDIEKKLKLPNLDAKNLAGELFGNDVVGQFSAGQKYVTLARQYMPAKSAKKPAPEDKPKRAKGHTYEFGRQNSYPLFWLKRAEISSSTTDSPFGGKVDGLLTDVASSPAMIGRPAVLQLRGDFPKQNLLGLEARAEFDHRGETPIERFTAKVASYPITGKELSSSDDLKFAFAKANGSGSLEGLVKGEQVAFSIANTFKNVSYDITAKS
jgi:uncharacterized protein (TIGR03545 family)